MATADSARPQVEGMWSCHRFSRFRLNQVVTFLRICSNGEIWTDTTSPSANRDSGRAQRSVRVAVSAATASTTAYSLFPPDFWTSIRYPSLTLPTAAAACRVRFFRPAPTVAPTRVDLLRAGDAPRDEGVEAVQPAHADMPGHRVLAVGQRAEGEPDVCQPRQRCAEEERAPHRVLPDVAHLVVLQRVPPGVGVFTGIRRDHHLRLVEFAVTGGPGRDHRLHGHPARGGVELHGGGVLQHDVVTPDLGDGVDDLLAALHLPGGLGDVDEFTHGEPGRRAAGDADLGERCAGVGPDRCAVDGQAFDGHVGRVAGRQRAVEIGQQRRSGADIADRLVRARGQEHGGARRDDAERRHGDQHVVAGARDRLGGEEQVGRASRPAVSPSTGAFAAKPSASSSVRVFAALSTAVEQAVHHGAAVAHFDGGARAEGRRLARAPW